MLPRLFLSPISTLERHHGDLELCGRYVLTCSTFCLEDPEEQASVPLSHLVTGQFITSKYGWTPNGAPAPPGYVNNCS